jgi:hypothetical protein
MLGSLKGLTAKVVRTEVRIARPGADGAFAVELCAPCVADEESVAKVSSAWERMALLEGRVRRAHEGKPERRAPRKEDLETRHDV